MALGGRDILRLIVDADSSGAIKEFNKLGKGIKDAAGDAEKQASGIRGSFGRAFDGLAQKSPMVSGVFDKMGVSASQAGAAIGAAIPMAAVAAGGAIAAFAAKGISDFQNIALAAGKFSDASGLSVEQASKWIEVADHIGVSETAVSSAFRRMGVAIGNNTAGWRDLGVQVVKNRDGSADLSATFLRVVTALQAIEDPTLRAAAAQKLFGKGYAEVAELIGRSAPELADMLNEVGDAKVITPEELEKARAFRGSMDDLGDSVQELGMKLGQALIPILTDAANALTGVIEKVGQIQEVIDKLPDPGRGDSWFSKVYNGARNAINPFDDVIKALHGVGEESDKVDEKAGGAADAVGVLGSGMAEMSKKAGDATTVLGGGFAEMSKLAETAADNNFKFGGSADAVAQNVGDEASALRDANDALAEHSNQLRSAYDSAFAFAEAERQQAEATLAATAASIDDTKSAGEKREAYDKVEKQTMATADALVEYTKKQALSSGATFDAADENKLFADTLRSLAQNQIPAVRDELLIMAGNFDTVGAKDAKPAVTLNDKATKPLGEIDGRLRTLDATNVAAHAGVDTSSANNSLDALKRRLQTAANQGVLIRPGGGPIAFGHGGLVPGASGAPQAAIVHGGEYVLSADVVDRIKRGGPSQGATVPGGLPLGGGAGGTVINLNGTFLGSRAEFGRIVDEALAESRRRGNRAS